ncbi:hypothetical protein EDC01DRAFT_630646 [Geopyxis carbonaria]|nr:hypothetical protein EDC01DRAFT_630646 [Geopyxis carbonaria]
MAHISQHDNPAKGSYAPKHNPLGFGANMYTAGMQEPYVDLRFAPYSSVPHMNPRNMNPASDQGRYAGETPAQVMPIIYRQEDLRPCTWDYTPEHTPISQINAFNAGGGNQGQHTVDIPPDVPPAAAKPERVPLIYAKPKQPVRDRGDLADSNLVQLGEELSKQRIGCVPPKDFSTLPYSDFEIKKKLPKPQNFDEALNRIALLEKRTKVLLGDIEAVHIARDQAEQAAYVADVDHHRSLFGMIKMLEIFIAAMGGDDDVESEVGRYRRELLQNGRAALRTDIPKVIMKGCMQSALGMVEVALQQGRPVPQDVLDLMQEVAATVASFRKKCEGNGA